MKPNLHTLWIIYDPYCGLCTMVKEWILQQPAFVKIYMVAAGSEEAQIRFPQIPVGELAVISDAGDVWLGNRAWIICLWALRDYREWSVRLSSPLLLPMARQAFTALSHNRAAFSKMLGHRSEKEIQWNLQQIIVPRCEAPPA